MDLDNLSQLQTEAVNPQTVHIDRMSTLDMCTAINTEDGMIAGSVTPWLPLIADTIDALAPRVRRGGRVIYVGAGTSGRSVGLFQELSRPFMTKRRIIQTRDTRRVGNPTDLCGTIFSICRADRWRRCGHSSGPRGRRG